MFDWRANFTVLLACVLACVVAAVAGFGFGFGFGHRSGKASVQSQADRAALMQLREQLDTFSTAAAEHTGLVEASKAASQQLRGAVAATETSNRRSTNELRQMLARSAGERAACRFDDGVMRELEAARARAAQAATGTTASGADAALPATADDADGGR